MRNVLRQNFNVNEVNRLLYADGPVVALRLGLELGVVNRAEVKKSWC